MRRVTSLQDESQHCSAGDADELINDPDHQVVLARRNLLIALAVTGMTTLVDCGGKTGLVSAEGSGETTPTSSATGASGSFAAAEDAPIATTSDAGSPFAAGGAAAVGEVQLDGGQVLGLDADQLEPADRDAEVDADSFLDAAEEDADGGGCVRMGGCKYCASCGISGGMDAADGDGWMDAGEADGGTDASEDGASPEASVDDAGADADDEDAAIAVCGGCRSCASCGCT